MSVLDRKGPGCINLVYASNNGFGPYRTGPHPWGDVDFAQAEARTLAHMYARARRATKPRARWNACGVGYWTVRLTIGGTLYQGVGLTLEEAYESFCALKQHVKQHAEKI